MKTATPMSVKHLYVSSGHNFVGHHGRAPGTHAMVECPEVLCVAGRGIEGDRFFTEKAGHDGQITFFAWETYAAICEALDVRGQAPSVFRRNVITAGADLNAWIGRQF